MGRIIISLAKRRERWWLRERDFFFLSDEREDVSTIKSESTHSVHLVMMRETGCGGEAFSKDEQWTWPEVGHGYVASVWTRDSFSGEASVSCLSWLTILPLLPFNHQQPLLLLLPTLLVIRAAIIFYFIFFFLMEDDYQTCFFFFFVLGKYILYLT